MRALASREAARTLPSLSGSRRAGVTEVISAANPAAAAQGAALGPSSQKRPHLSGPLLELEQEHHL